MPDDIIRLKEELEKTESAVKTTEAMRDTIADDVRSTMLAALHDKLKNLRNQIAVSSGPGAVAQGDAAKAAGERAVVAEDVGGNIVPGDRNIIAGGHVIRTGDGTTVVFGKDDAAVTLSAVDRGSALGQYLKYVIAHNRYLQLQGIQAGGELVHIALERIYITLKATRKHTRDVCDWIEHQAAHAPGELRRGAVNAGEGTQTVTVSVNEALQAHRLLVVLGDPGCGKTTLLRYLALLYARDLAEDTTLVRQKLALDETGRLPVLIPLRNIGAYITANHPVDDGTEGHTLLIEFLTTALKKDGVTLPADFFIEWLTQGKAVVLLDGLDEVADPDVRLRVSRIVMSFTRAYENCRFVVTSRIVGYTDLVRLGEKYAETVVQDFNLADVKTFLTIWHRLEAFTQFGESDSARIHASEQTRQLLKTIRENERIRDLAINPLMLTVIAVVHRNRVILPDRRAELYDEAVNVLLGKWETAKGLKTVPILPRNCTFDTGDKRQILQKLALRMHAENVKEIDNVTLTDRLTEMFDGFVHDRREAKQAGKRFLDVIEQRSGLLTARGEGIYSFSHLTFQEYLAALEITARDDYVDYIVARVPDRWWREVILLTASHLSTRGPEQTTRLIRAIADCPDEPELYHNLVLAAACLKDTGPNRVKGDLENDLQQRLRAEMEAPPPKGMFKSIRVRLAKGVSLEELAKRRIAAAEALSKIGGNRYWRMPHGEPEWVTVPAGKFWMGDDNDSNESPAHQVNLEEFAISRVPITNAQYQLFVKSSGHDAPRFWSDGRPPKGMDSHPVVGVSWYDAVDYCRWLSECVGKTVFLPSEAQWEKAARGGQDKRAYPWGEIFEANRCNCEELGLRTTTPVGIFWEGASPYGCLDMAGNVWEWTRTLYFKSDGSAYEYPYSSDDGREDEFASRDISRVIRGARSTMLRRTCAAPAATGTLLFTGSSTGFEWSSLPITSDL